MTDRILIAGGGEAALSVAVALRELGHVGNVTIVGDEPHPPYQRPPLSKEFLLKDTEESSLYLRAPEFYTEHRIDLMLGRKITGVALGDTGGIAALDDGTEVGFGKLALATGSVPRTLSVPGANLGGVVTLRSLADAATMRAELDRARDMVIIGGGFIGLEVAATARQRGVTVTVIEKNNRLMARVVAEQVSHFVHDHHVAQGIQITLGATVTAVRGTQGRVSSVVLEHRGREIEVPADVVVVGIGSIPTVGLATELGLRVDRGIVVDEYTRTGHPAVVAVGDCCVQPHPHIPGRLLGIESVNNAVEQGKIAARALLGEEPKARGVPWFWSNQGSLKIQIAGISDGFTDLVERADDERLTVLYYRAGLLIGADSINNPRDHMAVKRALGDGMTIDHEKAHDPGTPLKTLIVASRGRHNEAPSR